MQNSTVAPISLPSTGLRLLLAFLIGLLLGPNPFLPGWLQWAVPVVILTIALLVSIVLDPDIRQSFTTSGRTIISLLPLLFIAAILLAAVGILLGQLSGFIFIVFAVFPFLVGLLATFIVGSNGTWILALSTGLTAWLGSGLLFSLSNAPGFPLALPFTLVWVIPCFGIAALGGLAGRFLRVWSLGEIVANPLQMSATTSTLIRLLIAFALGLPTTLIFPFVKLPTPVWWRWEVPAGALIVAMLLSILLSPGVQKRAIPLVRVILSFVVVLLLAGVIIAAELILSSAAHQPASSLPLWLSIVMLALIPLSVGLAAAFSVGSGETWKLALGSALAAWLGAAIVNVIASILDYIAYHNGGDTDITLAFTLVAVALAFGIAAPGGILGRLLRNWLLQGG